jgi:hypothetical protein
VYIVTHGDKENGPNPRMTPKGFEQVRAMREVLPKEPKDVVSGIATRHFNVAEGLGLTITRYTCVAGDSTSLDKKPDGRKVIVFGDGREVPHDDNLVTTTKDMATASVQLLCELSDGTVVCAGRPLMLNLAEAGHQPITGPGKSASVYAVTTEVLAGGGERFISEITALAEDGVVGEGKAEL